MKLCWPVLCFLPCVANVAEPEPKSEAGSDSSSTQKVKKQILWTQTSLFLKTNSLSFVIFEISGLNQITSAYDLFWDFKNVEENRQMHFLHQEPESYPELYPEPDPEPGAEPN